MTMLSVASYQHCVFLVIETTATLHTRRTEKQTTAELRRCGHDVVMMASL